MKSLWQEKTRSELMARARRLTPAHQARWGKFTVDRMLAHMVDAFRMGMGEIEVRQRKIPIIGTWPFNVLFIRLIGMPKNAPTVREIIQRPPLSIDAELRELESAMERFAAQHQRTEWPRHPAFGKLSRRSWGVLGYVHTDHHLRQFGV
ncbi:MAG TPA: DUF1569 domain-containing protein [Gemmatimonadaceae bacterium]|nr:DUF1569 domain-containing protein [Gemmatimonadaceae bacterium]